MKFRDINFTKLSIKIEKAFAAKGLLVSICMFVIYIIATQLYLKWDVYNTRNNIERKIEMSNQILDSVYCLWLNGGVDDMYNAIENNQYIHNAIENNNLLVTIFDNNKLLYWSKPLKDHDTVFLNADNHKGKVSLINKRLATSISKGEGSRKVVIIIDLTAPRVKVEDNDYDRNIPSLFEIRDYKIADVPTDNSIDIYDKRDSTILFSLIPINKNIKNIPLDLFGWLSIFLIMYSLLVMIVRRSNIYNVARQLMLLLLVCICVFFFNILIDMPTHESLFFFRHNYYINKNSCRIFGEYATVGHFIISLILLISISFVVLRLKNKITVYLRNSNKWAKYMHVSFFTILFALSIIMLSSVTILTVMHNFTNKTVAEIFVINRNTTIIYYAIMLAMIPIPILMVYIKEMFCRKRMIKIMIFSILASAVFYLIFDNVMYNLGYIAIIINVVIAFFIILIKKNKYFISYVFYIALMSAVLTSVIISGNIEGNKIKQKHIALRLYENTDISENNPYSKILKYSDKNIGKNNYFTHIKLRNGKVVDYYGEGIYNFGNHHSDDYISVLTSNEDYYHYYLKGDNAGDIVVVSYPRIKIIDVASIFVYLFILLFLGQFFIYGIWIYLPSQGCLRTSLYSRIQLGILFGMGISSVSIMFVVMQYSISDKKQGYNKYIFSTFNSIIYDYEQNVMQQIDNFDELTRWIQNIETKMRVNVNVYDKDGRLVCYSNGKANSNKIIPQRISIDILNNHSVNSIFSVKESIENYFCELFYYKTKYGDDYIYIQAVFIDDSYMSGNKKFLVDVLNVIIITTIITILLSLFLYKQVMKPIKLIQDSIKNIRYRKKIDNNNYRKGSDIDTLIEQYNNTIDELTATYSELAKHERADAWRLIARQVAHEIKNPLTPIRLKAQMVLHRKHVGDPNWADSIEDTMRVIVSQTEILSKIVSEFSSFGKMKDNIPVRANISKICKDVSTFYSCYHYLNVRFENNNDDSLYANIDFDNFWNVMSNLITNSISAITTYRQDKNGEVVISVKKDGNNIEISVRDNGMGIPKDLQHNIFTPNFTTKRTGSGLGLVISLQMIKNMNGQLYFESNEGVGTTFFIILEQSNK